MKIESDISATTVALCRLLAMHKRAHVQALLGMQLPSASLAASRILLEELMDSSQLDGVAPLVGMTSSTLPQIGVVGFFDDTFPALLREIPDAPLVLFYQGDPTLLNECSIAIVGARRCTTQGRQRAEQVAEHIARQGIHVTSGMALGIDGAAHRGALDAGGPGRTIAVLGAGLDRLYPQSHVPLARRIVDQGGVVVSEYPPGTPPRAFRFPERNRLISGLGIATVVVEAGERSGSLITARLAAEQGRDVMAFPGPVDNIVSKGCHRLIQQGVGLVTNADEILSAAGIECELLEGVQGSTVVSKQPLESQANQLSVPMRHVLDCLTGYAMGFDEIASNCQIVGAELAQLLVQLELLGFVQQGPLGYIRTS